MAKKKQLKPIPENERRLAAKYFTISNLAMTEFIARFKGDINVAYSEVDNVMYQETGESITAEFKDWVKIIDEESLYIFNDWEKAKIEHSIKL